MSQRDLVAELRAARVVAPPEVRERVRLIARSAAPPRRMFTRRRWRMPKPSRTIMPPTIMAACTCNTQPMMLRRL